VIASVVMAVRNEEAHIGECLDALRGQSVRDIEIVIVDNGSTDGTRAAIASSGDPRIRCVCQPAPCGIAELRNAGVRLAGGDVIFFTDGDCAPTRHWVEQGLAALDEGGLAGVEGVTFYCYAEKVTIADVNTHQFEAGQFMTCNIAYRRSALEQAGLFDPAFTFGHEDLDLALRVQRVGRIGFSREMLVSHRRRRVSPGWYFAHARRAADMVRLNSKHGLALNARWRVLYPRKLPMLLCPPLVLLFEGFRTPGDLARVGPRVCALYYERAMIWRAAVRHRALFL